MTNKERYNINHLNNRIMLDYLSAIHPRFELRNIYLSEDNRSFYAMFYNFGEAYEIEETFTLRIEHDKLTGLVIHVVYNHKILGKDELLIRRERPDYSVVIDDLIFMNIHKGVM